MNYAEVSASLLQNLAINYQYNLGNILCGDEIYIKTLGKTNYVFFFSDPKSEIISSLQIYNFEDIKSTIKLLLISFHKY